MTRPEANGQRYIAISGQPIPFLEYANILRQHLGPQGAKLPSRQLPDWFIRLFVLFKPEMREVVPQLGKRRPTTSAKAGTVFGWTPRSVSEALNSTADSLFELGLI
jgi:dihydroflavonol-4-reductase